MAFPSSAQLLCALTIFQLSANSAICEQPSQPCAWNGPPISQVLSRHLGSREISGPLGATVIPFLQAKGLTISFISQGIGDSTVQLKINATATVRDVLDEITRQAPAYRYGTFDNKVIIYPEREGYDTLVEIEPEA